MNNAEIIDETIAQPRGPSSLSHARNGPNNVTVFESAQKTTAWLTVPTSMWVEVGDAR